jgi:hypothetical protein
VPVLATVKPVALAEEKVRRGAGGQGGIEAVAPEADSLAGLIEPVRTAAEQANVRFAAAPAGSAAKS